MTEPIQLIPPLTEKQARTLKVGERVRITGVIYAARDAAHKRMVTALERAERLPFDVDGAIIYYVGPTPGAPGQALGSAGPTTSSRMDSYAPLLIKQGLRGMIGKGNRSAPVVAAMKDHGAVYFAATGGAGAVLGKKIMRAEVVAYEELGPEALRRLEVVDFPALVAIDAEGKSLYERQNAG